MEAIEVTAHFDPQGRVSPLRFTWHGARFTIEATGRRWNAGDGLHILVMASGGRMFELVFDPAQGCWYLGKAEPNRYA